MNTLAIRDRQGRYRCPDCQRVLTHCTQRAARHYQTFSCPDQGCGYLLTISSIPRRLRNGHAPHSPHS